MGLTAGSADASPTFTLPVVQLRLNSGGVDLSGEEIVDGDPVVTVHAGPVSEEADIVEANRNIAVMRDTVSHPYNKDICYVLIPYVTISMLTWPWTKRASWSLTSFRSIITLPASSTMLVVVASLHPSSMPAAKYFWNRIKSLHILTSKLSSSCSTLGSSQQINLPRPMPITH